MTLDPADTIAAIASPPGPGLRGVIRLSGPRAWDVALVGFQPSDDEQLPDRSRSRTRKVSGFYRLDGLRPPLPATLLFWAGPRSYTGQDAAEVHTVGSRPLLEHLLSHFLMQDARGAEPGEFTLRAFLSGRIDLTQAEAVLGVIDARSPAQLSAALDQLGGGLAAPLKSLRDRLLDVLAHLEANLDFNDEPDVDELGRAELSESLAQGARDLAVLADQLKGRERPDGFPKVVLVGPPNAGKSRLFNALLGVDRAIVSPVAGTTRDYLSASCDCQGLTVELIDTAGAEDAQSPIEARAQAFRSEQAGLADLLIVCDEEDLDETSSPPLPDRPHLLVRTKCDLVRSFNGTRLPGAVRSLPGNEIVVNGPRADVFASSREGEAPAEPHWDGGSAGASPSRIELTRQPADQLYGESYTRNLHRLATSAATGEGLDELRSAIAATLRAQHSEDDLTTTTGARCRESLVRASDSLARAAAAIAIDAGDELVAADLRQSLDDLGRVVGAVVTDDILDRIFRRFCIGK